MWFIVPYLWGEVSKDDRPVTRTGYRSAYFDRCFLKLRLV